MSDLIAELWGQIRNLLEPSLLWLLDHPYITAAIFSAWVVTVFVVAYFTWQTPTCFGQPC